MFKENNDTNYTLYFEMVPVGTTSVKVKSIKNTSKNIVKFHVTRSDKVNPIFQVFHVTKKETTVNGYDFFNLKVSYSPNIPGSMDFDYFTVTDSRNICHKLTVRGESIGPSVSCSISHLTFLKMKDDEVNKEVVVLKNKSTVPAVFQFDCTNEESNVFTVEPIDGTIEPNDQIYISVRFFPEESTLYTKQLCCLILHHEPLMLNLLGTTDTYDPKTSFRFYPFPFEETVGFKGYLSDSVTLKKFPPPFSLSDNELDFGSIPSESLCQFLTTTLTNHMETPITVEWENTNLFKIYPEKLEIPPKQSALYECTFVPDDDEKLSEGIINGHVSWTLSEEEFRSVNVPIPISLRLIGHSFPEHRLWIGSVHVIPETVVLPLTLPNLPSWTTFMIQCGSHLPVLYKLIPPSKTNFIIKPMLGLIEKFQIVVVQLESKSSEPTMYKEKWSIEINGTKDRGTISIEAQTDVPKIVVGKNNVIQFDTMQPETKGSMFAAIRNISSCFLKYEFQPLARFDIEPSTGTLRPFEEILAFACYQSDIVETDLKEEEVICQVQFINIEKAQVGEWYKMSVKVFIEVIYSELCAFPHTTHVGKIELGRAIRARFHLFNFGQSYIFFNLMHNQNRSDVDLYPKSGVCGPRQKLLVSFRFIVRQLGMTELIITYKNRKESYSCEMLHKSTFGKDVFTLDCEGIFSSFQIMKLVEHNFGQYFSNGDLWRLFKIDEINSALLETMPGEIKRINLNVPVREVSDKLFYIVFSIESINEVTTVILKRRQICGCKLQEMGSFHTRVKFFDCPHRAQLTMEVSNSEIQTDTFEHLTFKIKYVFPNRQMMSYIMELSCDRTVILNVFIEGLDPDSYILSVYNNSCVLNMGHVFIGLREAPIFAFWLYNSSKNSAIFRVNNLEIVKLCNHEDFPVLKCLNCQGVVGAESSAPILFKFWPIEVKRYAVSVPVLLGPKQVILQVEGCGTNQINKFSFEKLSHISPKTVQNGVISLGVDRLMIEPVLVSSSTKRMFFINNLSRRIQVQYRWKPCVLDGLVKIEPLSTGGILKPKESHSVIIKIISLHEPCSIRMLLCCEFVDYDYLTKYQTSIKESKDRALNEFTFTDERTPSKKNLTKIKTETHPEPEYLHISLPIFINIIGISDRDNCVSAKDQMKQRPFDRIDLDVDQFMKKYLEKTKVKERPIRPEDQEEEKDLEVNFKFVDKEIIKSVIEHIASDAVFSDYFRELVKNLKSEPNPLYSQIKLDQSTKDQERTKEVRNLITKPKPSEVDQIYGEILLESLHNTFHLGPVNRSKPENDDNFM